MEPVEIGQKYGLTPQGAAGVTPQGAAGVRSVAGSKLYHPHACPREEVQLVNLYIGHADGSPDRHAGILVGHAVDGKNAGGVAVAGAVV